ncbi:fungal-specific transcription factor domain-containing protein [Trichoderma gracile]
MATRYYVRVLSAVRELIPRVSTSSSSSGSGSGFVSGRAIDLITDGNEASPVDDGSDVGEDDGSSSSKGKGKSKAKNKRNMAIQDKDTAEMAILASIFLCKYEIIKDGVENWRLHLRGIESLCQSLDADQAASMSETLAYVRSFMSYHKNIARITEYSPQPVDEFEHEPFEQDRLFPVDPYMGFSQSLIILLGRVNDLLMIDVWKEPEKLEQGIRELLRLLALRSWDAHRFAIPEGMKPSTIENSSHIAESYRCAVIACIHAVLELLAERKPDDADSSTRGPTSLDLSLQSESLSQLSLSPQALTQAQAQAQLEAQLRAQFQAQQAQPTMPINWVYLHALLPMTKADALTECLAAVARVPLGCPEEAGLLPLLFIVACETSRPEQAREALQRVELLGSHIGLGNVRCASALLNQVWMRRSKQVNFSDWRGLLADAKWDLIIT